VSRRKGGAPAVFGPSAPTVPGALWRPGRRSRTRARALALALAGALVLSACSAKTPKPTSASQQADAVREVLETMAEGLKARDATALASQWDPAAREDARARIEAALDRDGAPPGPVEVRFTPVAVRADGRRRLARVAWEGTWGGRKVEGTFDMELTTGEPPGILAIRGDDPLAGPTAPAEPEPPVP